MGLYNYGNNFSSVGDLPVNDRLYILQHKIIKQLAEKENFVVVGRCADYVLKDNPKLVKVYIYADLDKRIKRLLVALSSACLNTSGDTPLSLAAIEMSSLS